jgi:hypothetical protein
MTTQTSLNNRFTNDFLTVSRSNAGGDVKTTIANSNNTSTSSRAYLKLETGGSSGGDPTIVNFNNVAYYTYGMDNSDSDAFVISANASLGTSNAAKCYTTGEWDYVSQPAFSVNLNNTTINNVTGNLTDYTIAFSTEITDIGNNFNTGTYTFTAPVDGIYMFTGQMRLAASTGRQGYIRLKVDGTLIKMTSQEHPNDTALNAQITAILELDSSDAVTLIATGGGDGADTMDISGTNANTWFTGALLA